MSRGENVSRGLSVYGWNFGGTHVSNILLRICSMQELWSQRNSRCQVIHASGKERAVFSVGVRAATVVMQRRCKHASSTIEGLYFLRGPCRGVILKTAMEC
jgi:hypothetical protein